MKEVCLAYVPEAQVGDYVIVHAGFAISRLDREAAERVFVYLEEVGVVADGEDAMKFVDEYRDAASAHRYLAAIRALVTRPWTLMEVCGGQTHAIVRFGLDALLPPEVTLLHGPGCPVCVTPVELIDQAVAIACAAGGDLLLLRRHAARPWLGVRPAAPPRPRGGDVRVVYSPLDALELAVAIPAARSSSSRSASRPPRPATRWRCTRRGGAVSATSRSSFRTCSCRRRWRRSWPRPAIAWTASSPPATCARSWGWRSTGRSPTRYRVPIVVTGFEPLDLLQGIHMCLLQLEEGRAEVENQYARAVRDDGNLPARAMIDEVFEVVPRNWRGIGPIRRERPRGCGRRTPTTTPSAGSGSRASAATRTPPAAAGSSCRAC